MDFQQYLNSRTASELRSLVLVMYQRLVDLEEISFRPGESDSDLLTCIYWDGSGEDILEK